MGFFPGSSVSQRPTELFCASAQTKLLLVHPNKRTTGSISFGSFSAQWPQPTASEYGKLLCLNIWTVPEYPSQGRRVVSEGEGWVSGGVGFRLCAHVFDLSIPVSHVRLGLESGPASDMCGQTQTVTNIDPSYPRGTVYLSYVRGLGDV